MKDFILFLLTVGACYGSMLAVDRLTSSEVREELNLFHADSNEY